ncbi:MAG: alpha/beta hydrolase [Chloroflexi bacterium]|nr:alpha/beta hydrolase [Chloroflexota bacterium]
MTDFLLLHGGAHGAWVWDGVQGILDDVQRASAPVYHNLYTPGRILAVDLPGHGSRFGRENPKAITFEQCVAEVVAALGALYRPVLVAHSTSGHIALEAVRRAKEPPRRLVLVGAVVPVPPRTVLESLPLTTRLLLAALRMVPGSPKGTLRFHRELALKLLCNDMSYPTAAALVLGRLLPMPLKPFQEPSLWEALHLPCPVTSVVLTRDRFVPPDLQRRMAASLICPGVVEVLELGAGHEAPMSRPRELAQLLMQESRAPSLVSP